MKKIISNIVFSMNRPLQLEAYLESLYRHMPKDYIQTYIIYKVDLFDEQYSELFRQWSNCIVIKEQNFHDDFVGLVEQIDTSYILFGTDDVVYYDSVPPTLIDETFDKFSHDIFGFSLRLSPECFASINNTVDEIEKVDESLWRVNWNNAQSANARYPFELNSTVYKTALVREVVEHVATERPLLKKVFAKESTLVKSLSRMISMKHFLISINTFHDPNSLEGYCCRWCKKHKSKLPRYLYFQKLCASAIQVNRVNTTVDNPTDGSSEHTVEALNEKYTQGYKFDIEVIEENRPTTTHVGREYFKLIKR
jgi:hypothetical protein